MGLEYQHWFVVNDLNWVADHQQVKQLHQVLEEWGLIAKTPKLSTFLKGKAKTLKGKLHDLKSLPENLLVSYPFVENESISQIAGPSYYPEEEILERYFQSISLWLSQDFCIFPSSEVLYVNLISPAIRKNKTVSPYNVNPLGFLQVFPADAETTSPICELSVEEPGWPCPKNFSGVFRSALIFDCGKDLPQMMGKTNKFRSRKFVNQLESALGTKLIQIGFAY